MNKNEIVNQLNERLKKYSSFLENDIVEYASLIIEVGALIVGTEKNGKVFAQNVIYPTQFSKSEVDVILTMNWKDGNDKSVVPKVFNRNEWCREKIKSIQETMILLN